ncbi:MAG: 3-hydroxyacyl-[acyl-carrier-protein] dehydratase FabZ [Candidatus Binatia bacterium]|nr:MAG: 3-hydroxyacyl-[acyl-carrier-protein] dehydratase FabZ [Candidatus Binatia bacterium]
MPGVLAIYEIRELLPHRYPFCFVDRVLELVEGERVVACKNVCFDEPFFAGHFPHQPLMPGVLICEALAQAAALLAHRTLRASGSQKVVVLSGIDGARFRRPVVPGDQLVLEARVVKRRPPLWRFEAIAKVEGQVVAEAELLLSEAEQVRL